MDESTSTMKTIFNGLNVLTGIGILSVPYALSRVGWLGILLLLLIAGVTFYTGFLLRRCMDAHSDIRTYPDIGERAFGKKGRLIVSVFLYVEVYLVATGFLILEGDNLHHLFPNVGVHIWGLAIHGKIFFILVVSLIVLPSVWFDNLNFLSYVSATGVITSLIILGSVLWVGAVDGVGFHSKETSIFKWKGIPAATSLYLFCYGAHALFPTLYSSMRNKHQFSTVLIVCFIFCTITYGGMAVIGYLMFGSKLLPEITLNLPTKKLSSKIAIYTILVAPIVKYALMMTPIVRAIEIWLPYLHDKKPLSFLFRTTLVLSSMTIALTLPFFGSLMSLVGAFTIVTISILFPCIGYLKISGIYNKLGAEVVIIYGILLLGFSAGVMGTYMAIVEIVQQL